MQPSERMSPVELRAAISLSGIFGLRMLGMFVILPVFAFYAEGLPGGDNLTLVGIAIGVYGLTQACLQIPCGWWSDRYSRKPVIYVGLAIFAAGSFIAALGVVIFNTALSVIWLVVAAGTRVPAPRSMRAYALPAFDRGQADVLLARLRAQPGVHEARGASGERRAYLTVDSAAFDEQNVLKLISD